MRKRILIILGVVILISTSILLKKFDYHKEPNLITKNQIVSEVELPKNMLINPKWEEYEELSEEEKAQVEVIPDQYINIYVEDEDTATLFGGEELPTKYDLRDVDGLSYVTPIKNQKDLGLCWAFGTIASFESTMLKLGLSSPTLPLIFNERQLDYVRAKATNNKPSNQSTDMKVYNEGYNTYGWGNLGGGGNFREPATYITLGIGARIMQGNDFWGSYKRTHETFDLKDVFELQDYVATDYIDYPYLYQSYSEEVKNEYVNLIKEHILEYGATEISLLGPSTGYAHACYISHSKTNNGYSLLNVNNDCYDRNKFEYGDHDMAIIGWDDTYEQNYCALNSDGTTNTTMNKNECENNNGTYNEVKGAWIIKNSWGESSTDAIIYSPYNSTNWGIHGFTKIVNRDFDNYYDRNSAIYYTCEDGKFDNNIEKNHVSCKGTEVELSFLKSKNAEKMKRISMYVNGGENYTLYLSYPGNSEKTILGTVSAPQNKSGRYSIDLNNINLKENESEFIIAVRKNSGEGISMAPQAYVEVFTENSNSIENDINSYAFIETINEEQYLNVTSRTANLETGTKMIYKLYDKNGTDISNKFNDFVGYSQLNMFKNSFKSSSEIPAGKYTLTVSLEDGTLLDSHTFYHNYHEIQSVNATLLKTKYKAYEKVDTSGLSITLTYEDNSTAILTDGLTIKYNDNRNSFRMDDTKFTVTGVDSYGNTFDKDIPIDVEKATPQYTIPTNLKITIGKKLSDIELPNGFEWMNANQVVSESKNYKAKYIPEDTDNYLIVENIDIYIEMELKSIKNTTINVKSNLVYNGSLLEPFIITDNNTALMINSDYTISNLNRNAGTYTVTIQGKGNYKDTIEKEYSILPKALSIKIKNKQIEYGDILNLSNISDNIEITGLVTGEKPNVTGSITTNYTNSNVGTYTLTNKNITLIDNTSTNFKSTNYNITDINNGILTVIPKNVTGGVITLEKDSYKYTGTQIKPNIKSITLNGNVLNMPSENYTISYDANISNQGTVTLTCKENSNCSGTITKTFEIVKEIDEKLTYREGLELKDNYLLNIKENESLSILELKSGKGIKYYDKDTEISDLTTISKTGMKVTVVDNEYYLVINGDVSGDGQIKSNDLLKVRQHLLNIKLLEGVYFVAGDINKDNKINSADLLRLRQHLLKIKNVI